MSKRIQRVNQLIKREIGQILLREMDFPKNTIITVTRVETSIDLNQSRIYIGCLPENRRSEVLGILNRQIYDLQQKINKRLKMRPIPRIKFVEEKETEIASRVEELLEKIKK